MNKNKIIQIIAASAAAVCGFYKVETNKKVI